MLDNQLIPQVDSILRLRSFDQTINNGHVTKKAYEEFEVYNDHFGKVYYTSVKALMFGMPQKSRVGLIPIPQEETLFKIFGVKNSFMNRYQKLKNEYFESLDSAEDEEAAGYTKRELAKMERQIDFGRTLVQNLKGQKGFTSKEISRLTGVPITSIQNWGFFDQPKRTTTN